MNLLALRTEVLARGFDTIQYGTRVNQFLNDGLNLICRRVDYYVDETSVVVTAVPGAPYFALPTDFARARSLFDTDRNVEMGYVSIRDIDSSSQATGTPYSYAMTGAAVQLYPTPNTTYNLLLRYWKMPAQLVSDTDVPSLPVDWHHLLWVYATWMCFEADDDAQMGQYWQGRFNTELGMFAADQKFPDTDGPTQARGMWDKPRGLNTSSSWSLYGDG